jgi:pimeloyl-ACP methyl ester carboxylesterase
MDFKTFLDTVKHGYADSDGVIIHYAEIGEGPLVVMIHGFPDCWFTWWRQMLALAGQYRVIAIDQRGYNRSDKPEGLSNYAMEKLLKDVAAVILDADQESAIIIGHDWGGAVAWQFAIHVPHMTRRLAILNVSHPSALSRELATNPEQQAGSEYAQKFIEGSAADPGIIFGKPMTPENLAFWVQDPEEKQAYLEAFERSDFDAMLNIYKANYIRKPYDKAWQQAQQHPLPKLKMPVLVIHGLQDPAINAHGLNNCWEWCENDLSILTIPEAGHFVQHDAAEKVSKHLLAWLNLSK